MRKKLPTTVAALTLTATGFLAGTPAATGTAVAADAGPTRGAALSAPTVRQQADRIMNLGYAEFARTPHVRPFNWTSDGCSVPSGLAPYSEVFRPACVQHDFGYRNYGGNHELKLSPTRETKNWIDGRFRTEMGRVCDSTFSTPLRRQGCLSAADAYYLAVGVGGDRAFF